MPHITDDPDPERVGINDDGDPRTASGGKSHRAVGVYTPYRRVIAHIDTSDAADADPLTVPFDGLDVDVTVIHTGTGTVDWHVDVHGVANRVWEALGEGVELEIILGWKDGPQRTVARGPIQLMRPSTRRDERRYTLRGTTHAGATLKRRVSRTWTDAAPHEIARDLARIGNFTIGNVATDADVIGGNWTISNARPLSHWFDQLAKEAESDTDVRWTWYVHDDAVYFVPKGTPTAPSVTLSPSPGAGKFPTRHSPDPRAPQAPTGNERTFERKLDPEVHRGRPVNVSPLDGDDSDASTHVIGPHQFESSSRTGRHYVYGTLIPYHADYPTRPVKRGYVNPTIAPEEPDF